jgi:hypothetical protein
MVEMAICIPASAARISMGDCDVDEMVESDATLFAGSKWVEELFSSMLLWNSSLYEAVLIPGDISALNLALTVRRVDIPAWPTQVALFSMGKFTLCFLSRYQMLTTIPRLINLSSQVV